MIDETYINSDENFKWFGKHILLDIKKIQTKIEISPEYLQTKLHEAVILAGATILHSHFHDFGNGGISGVLVLSESHLSVHYWPEESYMGIDIYMCGNSDPNKCIRSICEFLRPLVTHITEHRRGLELI